jgi:hypothetical protein
MTEERKMTIAEALKEVKHIDQKILKRIGLVEDLSASTSDLKPKYETEGTQKEKVLSLIQSVKDLIKRKRLLKAAILKANLTTTVIWMNETYTLQDILLLKEGGKKGISGFVMYERLINALKKDAMLEDNIQNGRSSKENLSVTRYFDVETRDKMENWLFETKQNLDYLIENANFKTDIDLSPLASDEFDAVSSGGI